MPHALLSPSSASRWLNCTPSARLEESFPDTTSEYAKEGTLAHTLGELLIRKELKLIGNIAFKKSLKPISDNALYNDAMFDHADNYATFVIERLNDARARTKDALIFLEVKLDMSEYVKDGFGTGDVIIIADHVLDIIDLKYGKGVPVSAVENKQMMLYALGALKEYDYLYDINTVRMTIYQPRLDSVSTWEMEVDKLYEWANTELKPKAVLAYEGKGDFVPGNHCQFCKVRATCRAHADMNLELAKYDFTEPALLKDQEITDILDRAKVFENWLTAVKDYALSEAVNNGKEWPDYKLVEGRSNRKYSDEILVAKALTDAGYAEDVIYQKKLLGITAMESEIGKKSFTDLLKDFIVKPPGKPALVSITDSRPAYHSANAAKQDFLNV